MFRAPALALIATIGVLTSAAQSVELAMQLPRGEAPDAVYGELESGAMDRFFDAGLVLTTGPESDSPDIAGLCAQARDSYVEWVLLVDLDGAKSDKALAESLTWSLYRSRDGQSPDSKAVSQAVSLPAAASLIADRSQRLRQLGEALAASVLGFLHSGASIAPGSAQPSDSAGGHG